MKAYSYLKEHNISFPYAIGKEIGYGADGQVFDLIDFPNRVIKFSVLYQLYGSKELSKSFKDLEIKYHFLINHNFHHLVKIYDFGYLFTGMRNTVSGIESYIVYFSVMEKLAKPFEDENKVLKSLCDSYNKGYPISNIKELSDWYDCDTSKVLMFYHTIAGCNVKHLDIHRRNIMKDKNGNFKLIDLDRIEINGL